MEFDHILVTTDFSDDSISAFEMAAYQAKMSGSKLTLLTVVADWDVPETMLKQIPNPESVSAYRNELLKKAQTHLDELVGEHFHGVDVRAEAILSSGPIAQEITDYAKRHNTNLIIMSSHGRGAVGDWILGSVVQKSIRLSDCPVLVIPNKHG